MSGEGSDNQPPPSRGRRVLTWLDYAMSIIATGKPPIPEHERRRNQELFLRQKAELTQIALLVTLTYVVAVVTVARNLPAALPPLIVWGAIFTLFAWALKIAQCIMNRRRRRLWRR